MIAMKPEPPCLQREEVLQKAEEKLALAEQVKHLLNDKLGALGE